MVPAACIAFVVRTVVAEAMAGKAARDTFRMIKAHVP
jgi:hypothetical protein